MVDVAGNVYVGDYGKDAPVNHVSVSAPLFPFALSERVALAGHIDDVTIWRRPLQVAEIAALSRNLPVP